MAALTTQARVEKILPPNYNTPTEVISAAQWTILVDEGSREVMGRLKAKYVQFNGIADTPPTPAEIVTIVDRVVGAQALEIIRPAAFNSDFDPQVKEWREWVDKKIERLLNGKDSIGHESATQTLTFGTGGEYDLPNDCAFLNVQTETDASSDAGEEQPTIVAESVRVTATGLTGYLFGTHYSVGFHPGFQKWFLKDWKGSLRVHATPTVSYRWLYERHNQAPMPGRVKSGRLAFV